MAIVHEMEMILLNAIIEFDSIKIAGKGARCVQFFPCFPYLII